MKNSVILRNAIVATAFTACASQSLAQTKTNPEIGQPFHLSAQIAVADRLAGYPVNSGDTIKVTVDSGKTINMTLLGAVEGTSSYGPIIFHELGEGPGGCRIFEADLKDVVTSGAENVTPGEKTYASICYIDASFDVMPKATMDQLQAVGIDKTSALKYEQTLPSILPKEIVALESLRPILFNTAAMARNMVESAAPKIPFGTPVLANYAPGNQQIKYGPGLKPPAP